MSVRRNSPPLHAVAHLLREPVSRGASQAEMPGMETDDAAKVLIAEERRKQAKKDKAQSKEDLFDFQLRAHRLPAFVRQYPFAKSIGRRWLFDFANEEFHLAVEVEGLV